MPGHEVLAATGDARLHQFLVKFGRCLMHAVMHADFAVRHYLDRQDAQNKDTKTYDTE
jgi:hypothetical protein